jgi:ribonuclease HI
VRAYTVKSFLNREDAAAFVAGKNPPSEPKADAPEKYYAVARGRTPGIYTDWEPASLAITGTKGPKYKKFSTRAEAIAFIREFGDADVVLAMERAMRGMNAQEEEDDDDDDEDDEDEDEEEEEEEEEVAPKPVAKKPRVSSSTAAASGSGTGASSDILRIYTDGSSLGNGKRGATAGVGVYFGDGDPRLVMRCPQASLSL